MTNAPPIRLTDEASFTVGDVLVMPRSRTIAVGSIAAVIEPRVMQVLIVLGSHCGEVVSRDEMVAACWPGRFVGDDAINHAILKLRRALDDIGGSVRIQTVAKVGYRLSLGATPFLEDPAELPPITAETITAPTTLRRQMRQRLAQRLAIGVSAAVIFGFVAGHHGSDHRLVVVEPLQVASGDGSARRVAQDFTGDLSRVVLGHDTQLAFADARRAPEGAAFIVTGSAATIGTDLHAVVAITATDYPAILWSHDYTARASDLAGLRQQVSINLGAVLVCAAGTRGLPAKTDRRVFALYFEACNLHSGDQRIEADLLRQVLARAPGFANAWSDLAISLAFATDRERVGDPVAIRREAEEAALHALALDPRQGNAYYARSLLLPGLANWTARRRLLLAGLAVQPENAQLYARLAVDLAAIGRINDSIAAGRRAVTLDPLYPGKAARLARSLIDAGKRDEAADAVTDMREKWPDNSYTWAASFDVASRFGNPRVAAQMLAHPHNAVTSDQAAAWRAFLLARAMPTAANVDHAIDVMSAAQRGGVMSGAQVVDEVAALGRPATALRVALALIPESNSEPWFDSALATVRADPRFMTVMRRQGLVEVWRTTGLWPDFCSDHSLTYRCRAERD